MQIVSFLKGKIRNKEVFKKVTNKSRKSVRKIHRNTSRTAKSQKNVYDKSLEGENSLKKCRYSSFYSWWQSTSLLIMTSLISVLSELVPLQIFTWWFSESEGDESEPEHSSPQELQHRHSRYCSTAHNVFALMISWSSPFQD